MGNLLFDEYPILVLPELARKAGLNAAIVLQQVHYWTVRNQKSEQNFFDGRYWVFCTLDQWQKQFPWWSRATIRRIFADLETGGLILSGNFNNNKMDRTKWYCVNYDKLGENLPMCSN